MVLHTAVHRGAQKHHQKSSSLHLQPRVRTCTYVHVRVRTCTYKYIRVKINAINTI